jgi:4-hydroxy-tetrahydrodipicolinate synthase
MFQGLGTALITPFKEDLSVDYKALRKIVGFQLSASVDSLIVLGTTGEAPAIDKEESQKILSTVIEETHGKIPVIAGTGSNNVDHVIENNKIAEKCGASGLLIVTPYYNKGTQNSLFQFYKFIADQTDLPIILYNVPSRTGVNLLPETAIRLFQACNNIIGVKEAGGDISQIARLIATRPEGLKVYSGNDDQTLPVMALGGEGVISVISNIVPDRMRQLTDAMLARDLIEARKINNRLLKLMNDLFLEVNPIPVKYAAALMGLCRNTLRLPLAPISSENGKKLQITMQNLEII